MAKTDKILGVFCCIAAAAILILEQIDLVVVSVQLVNMFMHSRTPAAAAQTPSALILLLLSLPLLSPLPQSVSSGKTFLNELFSSLQDARSSCP